MLEAAEGPAPLLPLALLEKPNPTQPESDAPPKLILLDSALAALSAAARAAAKGSVMFASGGSAAPRSSGPLRHLVGLGVLQGRVPSR